MYQYFVLIARTSCPNKRSGSPDFGRQKKKIEGESRKKGLLIKAGGELKELSEKVLCGARGPVVPALNFAPF